MRNKENNFPIRTLIWRPAYCCLVAVRMFCVFNLWCSGLVCDCGIYSLVFFMLSVMDIPRYFADRTFFKIWLCTN